MEAREGIDDVIMRVVMACESTGFFLYGFRPGLTGGDEDSAAIPVCGGWNGAI